MQPQTTKRIVAALAFLVATFALAQERPRRGFGHRAFEFRRCLATLDLTDSQRTEIRQLFQSARLELHALGQALRADRRRLHELVQTDTPDRAAVGDAFLKLRSDRKAGIQRRRTIRDGVLSLLTPDQRSRLEACRSSVRRIADGPGPGTR